MIAAELIERHLVFPKLVSRESVFEVPVEQFLIQLVLLREAGRVDCIEPLQEPAPLSSGGTTGCEWRSSRSASFQPPSVQRDARPDSFDQAEWPSPLQEAIQRPQHAGD